MTKRKPNTDWNKAYCDMVRAGRKYLHVPGSEIWGFLLWVDGRVTPSASKRLDRALEAWPPKGVRIHIDEFVELRWRANFTDTR